MDRWQVWTQADQGTGPRGRALCLAGFPAVPTHLQWMRQLIHASLGVSSMAVQALEEGEVAGIDPEQAKARALEEEEARAAAKRSLGTAVTPGTFAAWKQRFLAETALAQVQRQRCSCKASSVIYMWVQAALIQCRRQG